MATRAEIKPLIKTLLEEGQNKMISLESWRSPLSALVTKSPSNVL